VTEHYHVRPYSASGLALPLVPLGTFAALLNVLAQESADVLVCRRNERWSGPLPRCERDARELLEQGYTLLVRHAERHDARLAELAAAFARDFASTVNIHIYCTPAGQYGFGWHYDAEEVFLVQTTGRKEYSLRKNTVNPWPLEETLPADMRFEREIMPVMRCELTAGDWLYIPAGYWHMGRSHETALRWPSACSPTRPSKYSIFSARNCCSRSSGDSAAGGRQRLGPRLRSWQRRAKRRFKHWPTTSRACSNPNQRELF
jgi:hypothetical protein